MRAIALAAGLCVLCLCGGMVWADEARVFDIPRLDGIIIDGNAADWGDRGMRVDLLADAAGKVKRTEDFDAAFRLGWNDHGLLILLTVHDDIWLEDPDEAFLHRMDGVELFLADKWRGANLVQACVAPGMDPCQPQVRTHTYDFRKDEPLKQVKPSVQAARTRISDHDYVMEILLPWDMVGIKPGVNAEAAFQIYVDDYDGKGGLFNAVWYPGVGTFNDTSKMYPIRLTEKGSSATLATARGGYEDLLHSRITVVGTASLAGKAVVIESNGIVLARGVMDGNANRPTAVVLFGFPPAGQEFGNVTISADGNVIATVLMPSAAFFRDRFIVGDRASEFVFSSKFFTGEEFPSGGFDRPDEMKQVIGPYETKVRFYDANFNEVSSAKQPGRYGAVVEVTPASGKKLHRFCTLYRRAGGLHLGNDSGDDPAQDRQWWVTLKRKVIYGTEKTFGQPFVGPVPIDGPPAPALHEGTLEQAGMKDGAVEKIDAVCKDWAADSNEGFAVCLARHGVVFFHKAYGRRYGGDMTVDTPSHMASITKLMSGTMMMMLVDQGRVNLDDTVDKYLPAMAGIEVKTPLTIRRLYNHTAGLWDHWGEDLNDLEERVADIYGHLKIGAAFEYCGTDFALGGRVIEAVSGEAIPQFSRKHLLGPLGCDHTESPYTSFGAMSTPMDIARFGQMLMNKGAYGRWRFIRPETFEQVLPRDVKTTSGQATYGVGCTFMNTPGLSARTFGHGAASAAVCRIDPDNELVIAVCRNGAGGSTHDAHLKLFLQAIVDGMNNRAATAPSDK